MRRYFQILNMLLLEIDLFLFLFGSQQPKKLAWLKEKDTCEGQHGCKTLKTKFLLLFLVIFNNFIRDMGLFQNLSF